MTALYHGGVPGLRPGDVIAPGHTRRVHVGCPMCAANAAGVSVPGSPVTQHTDRVYVTSSRLYAAHYASLWGRGDLYRVEATDLVTSSEDSIETWTTPQAVIVAVLDRAVLLTMSERRRLLRQWTDADRARGWVA